MEMASDETIKGEREDILRKCGEDEKSELLSGENVLCKCDEDEKNKLGSSEDLLCKYDENEKSKLGSDEDVLRKCDEDEKSKLGNDIGEENKEELENNHTTSSQAHTNLRSKFVPLRVFDHSNYQLLEKVENKNENENENGCELTKVSSITSSKMQSALDSVTSQQCIEDPILSYRRHECDNNNAIKDEKNNNDNNNAINDEKNNITNNEKNNITNDEKNNATNDESNSEKKEIENRNNSEKRQINNENKIYEDSRGTFSCSSSTEFSSSSTESGSSSTEFGSSNSSSREFNSSSSEFNSSNVFSLVPNSSDDLTSIAINNSEDLSSHYWNVLKGPISLDHKDLQDCSPRSRELEHKVNMTFKLKDSRISGWYDGRYLPINRISNGQSGIIYKAIDRNSNEQVAIKIQYLTHVAVNELEVLLKLNHDNIVKCKHYWFENNDRSIVLYIVLKYADSCDLLTLTQTNIKLPEPDVRVIIKQLLDGLEHAHELGICHRDLKLENILLTDNCTRVIIADWGFAGLVNNGGYLSNSMGSLYYVSPEVISNESYVGTEVDMWTIGVILYTLSTGCLPFYGSYKLQVLDKIRFCRPNYEISYMSADLIQLIDKLLSKKGIDRPTLSELKSCQWMRQNEPCLLLPNFNKEQH